MSDKQNAAVCCSSLAHVFPTMHRGLLCAAREDLLVIRRMMRAGGTNHCRPSGFSAFM